MTTAESSGERIQGSFSEVFGDALRGDHCTVRGIFSHDHELPVRDWAQAVTDADRELLRHCRGATLDVGCGPGRMSAHLAELGHPVLGIDIVREAVEQTRSRGVTALRRNVFDPVPGEGRWDTVLLADGNIGIGGAPAALLRRAADLLDHTGRVVCDLAVLGTGLQQHDARLVTDLKRSGPFPWAQVGPEAIAGVATDAGLRVRHLGETHGRWSAVLTR